MDEKVIVNFICCSKHMVVVKLEHGTHVMDIEEWEHIRKMLFRILEPKSKKRNTT